MQADPTPTDLTFESEPATLSHLPKETIEQVFTSLNPRELALAAGVCRTWQTLAAGAPWGRFYADTWRITPSILSAAQATSWHAAYSSRMLLARGFRGRPQQDRLFGHASGVKVARIVPDANLLLTGSVDRRLLLWDLNTGTKLAASLLHAGTVRCLTFDSDIMATGSSDHRIRVWRQRDESTPPEAADDAPDLAPTNPRVEDFPFRIDGERAVLGGGHSGPVSALELTPAALLSGSWDYCVRVWDRGAFSRGEESGNSDDEDGTSSAHLGGAGAGGWPPLKCIQSLHFDDWVTGMVLRRETLVVASGAEAHVVDAGSGGGLRKLYSVRRHASPAAVTAVQGTRDGRFLFYSTAEGGVYANDLRAPSDRHRNQQPAALREPAPASFACASAVTGLSWDYPWLAASLQNGEVLLLNADVAMGGSRGQSQHAQRAQRGQQWPSRALSAGAPGGAQCVDLLGQWLVAGHEAGVVATWDFGKAEKAERELEALRQAKRAARLKKKSRAGGGGGKGSGGGSGISGGGAVATSPTGNESERRGGSASTSSTRRAGGVSSLGARAAQKPRVPAPIGLLRHRASGEEARPQGTATWQVLSTSRQGSGEELPRDA